MTNHPFEYLEIDRLVVGLGRYGPGTKATTSFVKHAKITWNKASRLFRPKDSSTQISGNYLPSIFNDPLFQQALAASSKPNEVKKKATDNG